MVNPPSTLSISLQPAAADQPWELDEIFARGL